MWLFTIQTSDHNDEYQERCQLNIIKLHKPTWSRMYFFTFMFDNHSDYNVSIKLLQKLFDDTITDNISRLIH